jgi:hypothetical protein
MRAAAEQPSNLHCFLCILTLSHTFHYLSQLPVDRPTARSVFERIEGMIGRPAGGQLVSLVISDGM